MSDFDQESADIAKGGARILVTYIFAVAAAVFIVASAVHLATPMWNSWEARGTELGYAAVSSKRELLIKLNQDWTELEAKRVLSSRTDPQMVGIYASQQIAIVNRMKLEAASLPASEVPSEVQQLLH